MYLFLILLEHWIERLPKASAHIASLIAAAILALAGSDTAAQSNFEDSDWNQTFVPSCGFPDDIGGLPTVAWSNFEDDRKLTFTLQNGQMGGCSNDNVKRHRADFWERAEVTQSDRLRIGEVNIIEFEATFLEGFRGQRESFFQIHNWGSDCPAAPPLMMKMHQGNLQIQVFRAREASFFFGGGDVGEGRHVTVYESATRVDALYDLPQRFQIGFDIIDQDQALASIAIDEQILVDAIRVDIASCALPYIKLGIYRPGGQSAISRIAYDDVNITHQQRIQRID